MVSNINEFIKETNKEIEKLQAKQVSEAKNIVLGAYYLISEFSPVDKGQFKNNNLVSVNRTFNMAVAENSNEPLGIAATDTEQFKRTESEIDKCKFNHRDTIYIQNNLDYADALEAGHSKQAKGSSAIYGKAERIIETRLAKDTEI